MKLEQSILETERSIISELKSAQTGIDDRTGKGTSAEEIIDSRILTPHLPPRFQAQKGSVIVRGQDEQSEAIDRNAQDASGTSPNLLRCLHQWRFWQGCATILRTAAYRWPWRSVAVRYSDLGGASGGL